MIKILPDWYEDVHKKIMDIIFDIQGKQNLNLQWVLDSKTISDSVDNIALTLVLIQEQGKPELPKKLHKTSQKLLKEYEKNEQDEKENK